MAATSDFFIEARAEPISLPYVVGSDAILRPIQMACGLGMIVAAFFLWIAPGATWDADLVLFKSVVTIILGFGGLMFLQTGRAAPGVQEVQIDLAAQRLSILRRNIRGAIVPQTFRLAQLRIERSSPDIVEFRDQHGAHIADVMLKDAQLRRHLLTAFQSAKTHERAGL